MLTSGDNASSGSPPDYSNSNTSTSNNSNGRGDATILRTVPLNARELQMVQQLETGDMLFFGGNAWTSRLIAQSGHCPWSHVAMVVRVPDIQELALWEATNGPAFGQLDILTGRPSSGVRLVALKQRLELRWAEGEPHYGVAKLRIPVDMRATFERRVWDFVQLQVGKPYEQNLWKLLWAWYDGPWSLLLCGCLSNTVGSYPSTSGLNTPDTGSWFCSKLIFATLEAANVLRGRPLPPNIYKLDTEPPDEYTVGDLCDTRHLPYVQPSVHYTPTQRVQ